MFVEDASQIVREVVVPFDAQNLQVMQGAHLKRQRLDAVVEQQQLAEVDQHAELAGQRAQFVQRHIEEGQVPQPAHQRREIGELVAVEVQLGEEVVVEQRHGNHPQTLAAEVQCRPHVTLTRVFGSEYRGAAVVFVFGVLLGAVVRSRHHALVDGRMGASIGMGLAHFSGARGQRVLLLPEFRLGLMQIAGNAAWGSILHMAGRKARSRVGQGAAGNGVLMVDELDTMRAARVVLVGRVLMRRHRGTLMWLERLSEAHGHGIALVARPRAHQAVVARVLVVLAVHGEPGRGVRPGGPRRRGSVGVEGKAGVMD